MGIIKIFEILDAQYPTYLSYKQIIKLAKVTEASVVKSLKALEKRDEIELRVVWSDKLRGGWKTLYRIKRGN